MLGTAFEQPGVLLVEQPGPWGPAGLTESRLDREVAIAVEERARTSGLRTLAIRRPGRSDSGRVRRWAALLPRTGALRWGTYEHDSELLDRPWDGGAGTLDAAPLYLVCAHSKRDRCCAVLGRPVAAALEELRPGRVWECSHTGGHRFAPIVLALPAGALYGRLDPAIVPALVRATERGEVLPERLRGVVGHSGPEQAALAYAQQRTGRTALGDLRVEGSEQGEDGEWLVRLNGYEVTVGVGLVQTPYPSCGKPDPKPERQYRPRDLSRR